MRVFLASLVLAAALVARPAAASEGGTKAVAPTVLMSPVALPVIVEGRLANYIYVTLRLNLSPKVDAAKMREKEPFFRDALVRAAHRAPLWRAGDPNALDEAKLRAVILRESAVIAGPGSVTGYQLLRAQPQRYLPKIPPAPKS
jgi:hypothetical protein